MSTPFYLLVPRNLYQEMIDQALAERPNECCGLLAGRILEPLATGLPPRAEALGRFPLVNAAASPVEYLSEPKSMLAAVRAIDEQKLDLLAVYHSHPSSDPVPSRKDRELNYSPQVMNLIISLKTQNPEVRAWWLTAEDCLEGKIQVTERPANRGFQ